MSALPTGIERSGTAANAAAHLRHSGGHDRFYGDAACLRRESVRHSVSARPKCGKA